jgi:DNA-binding NarL/FixJ family response regulator
MSAKRTTGPRPGAARVLIVDDHELARAGLRSMLSRAAGINIAGEAANAADAVVLCGQTQPDLVLMDVRMPGQDGPDAIVAIREVSPATRIVMVTIRDDPSTVVRAIAAGAAGYVLKDTSRKDLLDAVQRVLGGEVVVDPRLTRPTYQLIQDIVAKPETPAIPPIDPLTRRELEVLQLMAWGRTNPEIADILGISTGTVKTHVQRIIAKLGVTDRTQAAVKGVQLGLVSPDEPSTPERPNSI